MQKYVCDACGWIYDPAENDNVAFADLAEDWVCPECGVGKDLFSQIDQVINSAAGNYAGSIRINLFYQIFVKTQRENGRVEQ